MCLCSVFYRLSASCGMSGPLGVVCASVSTHSLDLVGALMHDDLSQHYHHCPHRFLVTDHLGCCRLHALRHELGEAMVPLHPILWAMALLVGRAIPLAKG